MAKIKTADKVSIQNIISKSTKIGLKVTESIKVLFAEDTVIDHTVVNFF